MPPDTQKLAPSKGHCAETGLNLHWVVLAGGYKAGASPCSAPSRLAFYLHWLCMQGHVMQNRALEGDEVALQILPPSQWFISGSMLERAKASEAEGDSAVSASPTDQPPLPDRDAAASSLDGAFPADSPSMPAAERCNLLNLPGPMTAWMLEAFSALQNLGVGEEVCSRQS